MAVKKTDDTEYNALRDAIAGGNPENFYIFHGEESYLLEYNLKKLREIADAGGMGSFNYRRFDGKTLTVEKLSDAIETLPAFSDRTMVEVHDFNMFKLDEDSRERLAGVLEELPEYVCLVFVFDTVEYAPDQRLKTTKRILKNAHVVEFTARSQSELTKWIAAHFKAVGKKISKDDAEYLTFITGGLMTTLAGEIEKTAAYAKGETVTRQDIDEVVIPVVDAVSYKLTDAVCSGNFRDAAKVLDELLQMREPPHKLIYSISMRMRQMYMARLCIDAGKGENDLMEKAAIRTPFQARNVMQSARGISTETARAAVISCAETALSMNSGTEPEEAIKTLLLTLSKQRGAAK